MVALSVFSEPTDRIRHEQPNTTVYVNDNNIGKGTLYIGESYLSWRSNSGNGFTLEYPHISLHAISRDLTAFPEECIFMMLDTDFSGEAESSSSDDDDGDSGGQVTELRLVPDDRGMLDAMFNALNICQTLHPDPEDGFSDEDFFEDADEDANEDIYMEETDLQMANMRIKNTDEASHMNFVGPDRIEIFGMRNMRSKYLLNIDLRDKFEDTVSEMKEDMFEDIFEDTVEEEEKNTEDTVVEQQDIVVEKQGIVAEKQGVVVVEQQDIVAEKQGVVVVEQQDIVAEKQGVVVEQQDIVAVQKNIAAVQKNIAAAQQDIVVVQQDTVEGQNFVEDRSYILDDKAQGGRSSFEENMWPQNRKEHSRPQRKPYTDPESNNFDDVEC